MHRILLALALLAALLAPVQRADAAPSGLWVGTPYVSGSYVRASFDFWNDGTGRSWTVSLRYGGNWTTCTSGWAAPSSHVVGNCGVWTVASGGVSWRGDLNVSGGYYDLSPTTTLNRRP